MKLQLKFQFCSFLTKRCAICCCLPALVSMYTVYLVCLLFVFALFVEHAFRRCTENGTWFVNMSSGITWIDYRQCFTEADLVRFKYLVNYLWGKQIKPDLMIVLWPVLTCVHMKVIRALYLNEHVKWIFYIDQSWKQQARWWWKTEQT